MKRLNTIGTSKVNNNIGSAGVGYVIIPDGIDDLKSYVEDCYRTNTLTIWGGRGYGYFSHVHVDQDVMQNIQFPNNPDENNRGTAVVWVKDENSQLPIIIASLRKQDDFYMLEPNQCRISRSRGNRTVELFLDAKNSEATINVFGDSEEPANMKIKVVSENKDSKFSISSDNLVRVDAKKVDVVATDETNLKIEQEGKTKGHIRYKLGEGIKVITEEKTELIIRDENDEEKTKATYELENGFTYEDEFKNSVKVCDGEIEVKVNEDKADFHYKQDDGFTYKDQFNNEVVCKNGEIDITGQKIVEKGNVQHNNGSEPMVKGQTLMTWLNNLCTQLMAITVPTAVGPSGSPVNAAAIGALQGQLNNILSQQSKLD